MRKIYVSKIDINRQYQIFIAGCAFAIVTYSFFIMTSPFYKAGLKSSFDRIAAPITFGAIICYLLYEGFRWLLSGFNILVINANRITYVDPGLGYGRIEYKERVLCRNKNRSIEVTRTLFIQPVRMHGKIVGDRSYTFIGTSPPFDGNKFIFDSNQIIMRESSVFVSALKESFDCVELEPFVMNEKEEAMGIYYK